MLMIVIKITLKKMVSKMRLNIYSTCNPKKCNGRYTRILLYTLEAILPQIRCKYWNQVNLQHRFHWSAADMPMRQAKGSGGNYLAPQTT